MTDEGQPQFRFHAGPRMAPSASGVVAVAGTGGAKPVKLLHDEVIEHYIENYDFTRAKRPYAQIRREMLGTELLYQTTASCSVEDCMVEAAQQALTRARMAMGDIGEIVVSTLSPSDLLTGVRSKIIDGLGMETFPVIELHHGCAGGLFALEVGRGRVTVTGQPVLVIGGDDIRRHLVDLRDWAQAGIFGGGAGAAVLVPSDSANGLHPASFWTDSKCAQLASMNPMTRKLHMEGKQLGQLVPDAYLQMFRRVVEEYSIPLDRVYVIPHQLNGHLIERFRQNTQLETNQVLNIVNQFGNTSNASTLLALNHAVTNRLSEGDFGVLFGVGSGFDFIHLLFKPDRSLVEKRTIRILIADDDAGYRDSKVSLYDLLLNDHKRKPDNVTFEYRAVSNGEEAIEVAQEYHPSILDFDQRMGKVSGSFAARVIHGQLGPIPTVIHSGYSDNADWEAYGAIKLQEDYKSYQIKNEVSGRDYVDFLIDFMYRTNVF